MKHIKAAMERFYHPEQDGYTVEYVDIKNPVVFVPSLRVELTNLMVQLEDFHKDLMKKEFDKLGLKEEMELDWEWYKKHSHVYALKHHDSIVGVCTCGTYKTGRRAKHVCYIMDLIIDPDHRGKGLGSYLLDKSVLDCKKHESYISCVMIDVFDANSRAMKMYTANGYKFFRHSLYKSI